MEQSPRCFLLSIDAQAALLISPALLSLVGSAFLAGSCAWLLRRHPDSLLLLQLSRLGLADTGFAVWAICIYVGVFSGVRHFTKCHWYVTMERFLLILSILFSLSFGLGLVFELQRIRTPGVLRKVDYLAPCLAIVLNIVYILDYKSNIHVIEGDAEVCGSTGLASEVYVVEVTTIFVSVSALHGIVLLQAWGSAPRSVARRSARSAARYLLAFFSTHTLYVIKKIWLWYLPDYPATCHWDLFRLTTRFMLNLNGFFNFLAFAGHVWYIHSRSRRTSALAAETSSPGMSMSLRSASLRPKQVNFYAQERLQEMLEVPYEERRPAPEEHGEDLPELDTCLAELSFFHQRRNVLAGSAPSSAFRTNATDGGRTELESSSDRVSFGDGQ